MSDDQIKIKNVVIVDGSTIKTKYSSSDFEERKNKFFKWALVQPHDAKFEVCGIFGTYRIWHSPGHDLYIDLYNQDSYCYMHLATHSNICSKNRINHQFLFEQLINHLEFED